MLSPSRNMVPGHVKQSGGPDSAHRPCVCPPWLRVINSLVGLNISMNKYKKDIWLYSRK